MRFLPIYLLLLCAVPWVSLAEEHAASVLSSEEKHGVVKALGSALKMHYVHQDKVSFIVSSLNKRMRGGSFDSAETPQQLADLLSKALIDISNDFHFIVAYDPDWIAQNASENEHETSLALREDSIESLRRLNFGFKKLKILEGNIGYVRFDYFPDPEHSFEAGAQAMHFVENTDALIFDLRYSRGGHNQFGQFLSSYLFAAGEPQLLHEYTYREDGKTIDGIFQSLPILPGPRMADIPVYVLTSTTTFSAGEWFAYALQKLQRAEIVGQQTSGASHSVNRKAIDKQFILQVPVGVGRDPVDKSDFEGVGVVPDHDVPSISAPAVAHKLAFEKIAAQSPAASELLTWVLPVLNASINKPAIQADSLARFAGQYEGRRIELLNDRLFYHWRGRFNLALTPLASNLFAIEGIDDFRFRFAESDGQISALERVERDGRVIVYQRL